MPSCLLHFKKLRVFHFAPNPIIFAPRELLNLFAALDLNFYTFPGNEGYSKKADEDAERIIENLKKRGCEGLYIWENGCFSEFKKENH